LSAGALTLVTYIAVTLAANAFYRTPIDMPSGVADVVMLVPFALLIASAATSDISERPTWLRGDGIVRLGKASFALYLVHQPIFELAERIVPSERAFEKSLGFLLALLVSLLAAELAHRAIEKPIEWRLRARMGGRSAPIGVDEA